MRNVTRGGRCLDSPRHRPSTRNHPVPTSHADRHVQSMSPYGSAEAVLDVVFGQLGRGPYIAGERCTAADVLWGAALDWMTAFKLIDPPPAVRAYVDRMMAKPGVLRAGERDRELMAAAQPEAGGTAA